MNAPQITQLPMSSDDIDFANRIARRLGYEQTAYTSTSAIWGLYCLNENPETWKGNKRAIEAGCIIKTKQFGFLFVQDLEDLQFHDLYEETL